MLLKQWLDIDKSTYISQIIYLAHFMSKRLADFYAKITQILNDKQKAINDNEPLHRIV